MQICVRLSWKIFDIKNGLKGVIIKQGLPIKRNSISVGCMKDKISAVIMYMLACW